MYLKCVQIFVQKITVLPNSVQVFEYNQLYYDSSKIYNTNYKKQISMYKIVRTNTVSADDSKITRAESK